MPEFEFYEHATLYDLKPEAVVARCTKCAQLFFASSMKEAEDMTTDATCCPKSA